MTTRKPLKHGMAPRVGRCVEYSIWKAMRMRCAGRSKKDAHMYVGRGITVCERWNDFAAFLADMGHRPSADHSIDRIDNGKGYSPDNCRWATRVEQGRNKTNNALITIEGETLPIVAWAERYGIAASNIEQRIRKLGWAPDRAVKTPVARP